MNSDILRKTKNTKPLIIFLVVTVILTILGFVIPSMMGVGGKNFRENRDSVYEAVYLEFDSKPIEFKAYNDGKMRSFYLVSSGDANYIVKMSDKQYKVIVDEYEKNNKDFKFTLEGKTYSIFSTLQESSKKKYNELKDEKVITSDNYSEYFGSTYLDAGDNTRALIKVMLFGFAVFFLVIDIIMVIGYTYGMKTFKKVMQEYGEEVLVKELDDNDTIALPKAGIYLTKKYIISNSVGFKVLDYKDVLWVYILKQKNHGITVGNHLMIYKNDGKGDTYATMLKPEKLEELISEIKKRSKKILVGYTNENQKKYREIVKENSK